MVKTVCECSIQSDYFYFKVHPETLPIHGPKRMGTTIISLILSNIEAIFLG